VPHEFNGEEYQQASSHQKEWGNKIISELALKGNERILDLGCGDGALTTELAARVPDGHVLGIDASRGMIEVARRLETPNLSFKLLDINCLEYNNEFDLVFSNATLHWVKDHTLLLSSVFRCLKEHGVLRFNFAADGNCSHFIKIVINAIKRPEYAKNFSNFEWPWYMPEIETYQALVNQLPFREVRVWGENADRYFPDVDAMVKWVDQPSLVPFLECVSSTEKQGFRNYVVKQMIETTLQQDGRCFETFRRINVLARK
jgi:trans-aconitate 2-methyltransferase